MGFREAGAPGGDSYWFEAKGTARTSFGDPRQCPVLLGFMIGRPAGLQSFGVFSLTLWLTFFRGQDTLQTVLPDMNVPLRSLHRNVPGQVVQRIRIDFLGPARDGRVAN